MYLFPQKRQFPNMAKVIKRKRGRPRKYPKPQQNNKDVNPESIAVEDSDPNNSVEVPSVPTKIENVENISDSSEDSDAESSEDQETFAMPERWQTIDWETLRLEGWRPRVKKNTDGREYVTMRLEWSDEDGRRRSKERSFGSYDEAKYKMLENLLSLEPYVRGSRIIKSGSNESIEAEESSESKPIQMPEGPRLPPRYVIREARILRSPVGRSINIPNQFFYGTDILELFEHFKNKGYVGDIVDWMHECVRNYLIEHHYRVGVILERGNT